MPPMDGFLMMLPPAHRHERFFARDRQDEAAQHSHNALVAGRI